MRKIIFILFLVFSNVLFSQLKDTVFGKVKSVKEKIIFLDKKRQNYRLLDMDGDYGHSGFSSNKYTKSRFYSNWYHSGFVHYLNYYKEFDIEGKPTNEEWYDKDNDVVSRYEYQYNKNKKIVQEKEIYSYDGSYKVFNYSYNDYDNSLQSRIYYLSSYPERFEYSNYLFVKKDSLQLIEFNNYDEEGALNGMKFVYDEFGRKKQILYRNYWVTEYHDDGSSVSYRGRVGKDQINEEYFYDVKGNLVETHRFRQSFKNKNIIELASKEKNYYDENGLLEKKITTSENDTLRTFVEYKYDDKNRIIEQAHIHDRFEKKSDDLIFDKSNFKIDGIILPKEELIIGTLKKYKYDQNNIVELIVMSTFGETRTTTCKFEYVFDDKNNWVEQVKYIDGKKLYVWKRKIRYYE